MTEAKNHYHALDGLRAICIFFTIANHTPNNYYVNGTVGVDVFFALSGYLITTLLVRERLESGKVCLACFYIRRFFRITPLYFLTVLLYFPSVLISYYATGNEKGIHDFWNALPYLLTFNSEWRSADAGVLFGHAWTLGIEEKYYLIWPVLFLFLGRRKGVLWFVPLMPLFFFLGEMSGRGYIGILTGSIVALFAEREKGGYILTIPVHIWFGLMVGGYAVATLCKNDSLNVLKSIPAAFFIANLVKNRSIFRDVLSVKPLSWLGTLTYGIYLIHRLVGHVYEELFQHIDFQPGFWLYFFCTYFSSVIAALMLQHSIERPMIALGKRLSDAYQGRSASPATYLYAPMKSRD